MVLQACSMTGCVDAAIERYLQATLQQIEKDQTRMDTWRRKAEKLGIRLH